MIKYFYYYDRKYSISDKGEIIRLEYQDIRIQKYSGRCIKLLRTNKDKHLIPFIDKDGYANVTLFCKPNRRTYLVHHLVYIVFILNIRNITNQNIIDYKNNFNQINHIDGNKLNNVPHMLLNTKYIIVK